MRSSTSERAPPSIPSARTTVDLILQGSTVELFHAHGIGVAPIGSKPVGSHRRYHDVVGVIAFEAFSSSNTLTLSIPTPAFETHCESRHATDRTTLADWTQELTNQLLGRIKNRLVMFQTSIAPHLPSTMSGSTLERLRKRGPDEVLYQFRSLRGDILVTFDAPLADVVLVYTGNTAVVQEGDVILF